MQKEPKIIMKETEKITITKHSLDEFDCVLIYGKTDNEDVPVLIGVVECMVDVSYNGNETYILVNLIGNGLRGIYPCGYCLEFWEEFMEDYFSNPSDYYYVYKRSSEYTVNEEYYLK